MHRPRNGQDFATLSLVRPAHLDVADTVRLVLESQPMRALAALLSRNGLEVEIQPIVYKDLSGTLTRLMFPVTGGPIVDGAVVSVVCLFDRKSRETLYAHPMHAGPGVNPLVRHLDGPLAAPKSQSGADGDRASRRIIEHKQALWDRFIHELPILGKEEADQRWREGYYWSLQRLYFCSGCTQCKWGSPFFDGPDPLVSSASTVATVSTNGDISPKLHDQYSEIVADILSSDAWRVETTYAARGGFSLIDSPRLLKELDSEFVQVIFSTNAVLLQAGTLVAVAFTYQIRSQEVVLSHCLCAGPESEIQFQKGDVAFGLPLPQSGHLGKDARSAYRSWRRRAWSQFWLNDLDNGTAVASGRWLEAFWAAIEALFGGNDLSYGSQPVRRSPELDMPDAINTTRRKPIVPPQALENIGGRCFTGHATNRSRSELRALGLSTLMVNVGLQSGVPPLPCRVGAQSHGRNDP